jgi:hypothetical protein
MDVKEKQLAGSEQEIVLRGLALSAARPGCRFLEIGSWCGDSTVLFAEVVREVGGILFCIDWWKGNAGTELADIAAREDIFTHFWHRISRAGLGEVVVPVRGRSEVVLEVLRENSFQLIFLDADHRYSSVRREIADAISLLNKDGGILCGHDCEGNFGDFDPEFLEAGKELDCYESVHCGVVCAVSEAFADYSLNHSIWSVRACGKAGWEATNLVFPDIPDRRQSPPPVIASTHSHNLIRLGKRVFAAPHSLPEFDVTDEGQRNQPGIYSAHTLTEAARIVFEEERRVREAMERARKAEAERQRKEAEHRALFSTTLREEGYFGFNIVSYGGCYYALAQNIGPVDISNLTRQAIADLKGRGSLFVADSHEEAQAQVRGLRKPAACTPAR